LINRWNNDIDSGNRKKIEDDNRDLQDSRGANCSADLYKIFGSVSSCIQEQNNNVARAQKSISDDSALFQRERSRGGALRANSYVFDIVRKNNYEGNVIVYLNIRTKGTDSVAQEKLTLQCAGGQWKMITVEKSSSSDP